MPNSDGFSQVPAHVSLHLFDDWGVLLDANLQRIYRLDRASTLLWCCFAEGWDDAQIESLLCERHGHSLNEARAQVRLARAEWGEQGLLSNSRFGESSKRGTPFPNMVATSPPLIRASLAGEQCLSLGLLDCVMELVGLPRHVIAGLREAFAPCIAKPGAAASHRLALVRDKPGYVLTRCEKVIHRCEASQTVVPMLKAALIQLALEESDTFAILHAAAVRRCDAIIVLPGEPGSGKSTLAAQLALAGWGVLADDITVFTCQPALRVRPVSTALCLKSGAWPVVAEHAPQIVNLTSHLRADGQRVRYFCAPDSGASVDLPPKAITAIVFPRFAPGASLDVRPLGTVDIFERILPQFYPTSNRFEPETIERLVDLVRDTPAVELRYGTGAEAVGIIEEWSQ